VHSDPHSDGDGGDWCSGGGTTGKGVHEVRQRLEKAMPHSVGTKGEHSSGGMELAPSAMAADALWRVRAA
jgi:hypothetical protein